MKRKTAYVCQECGYDSPAYLGKCPECGNWNTLKEITLSESISKTPGAKREVTNLIPKTISEITYQKGSRIITGFEEMDGVFGGGIVHGSVTLLAGDPGIGKSTLLLQLAHNISSNKVVPSASSGQALNKVKDPMKMQKDSSVAPQNDNNSSVLYISAEESEEQIKLRIDRIYPKLNNKSLLILSITDTDSVVEVIEKFKPSLVIIDSIQTMESQNVGGLSGSIGQVRYSTSAFVRCAKQNKIPFIIVGHVTKEGMVAGPMTLSHMVDTVLFLEGEKMTNTRILRSLKNRFGPIDEVGVFMMEGSGMKEIRHPEHIFLSDSKINAPGSVLTTTLEGSRAFLLEIQALVVSSKLPMPRRVASGVDNRRLELLLAVLQKHARLPVATSDVFVNVAGGLKTQDPAADLAICLSIFSSLHNTDLSKVVAISEVGLLGELRKVPMLDKRIKEAKKLGFSAIISAKEYKGIGEVIKKMTNS